MLVCKAYVRKIEEEEKVRSTRYGHYGGGRFRAATEAFKEKRHVELNLGFLRSKGGRDHLKLEAS